MADKVKILIADDAPEFAGRLSRLLSGLDYVEVVGPARDGREAVDLFLSHRPQAAVLDFNMPFLNGIQVLQRIREVDPIVIGVLLTSSEEPELRSHCLNAGADYFLRKASEADRLLEIFGDLAKRLRKA